MSTSRDPSGVEIPRAEPEIIPPSGRGELGSSFDFAYDQVAPSYIRFKVTRIGPVQLFLWGVIALFIIAILVFLFASAFIFVAAFAGLAVLVSVVFAYVRGFLRR